MVSVLGRGSKGPRSGVLGRFKRSTSVVSVALLTGALLAACGSSGSSSGSASASNKVVTIGAGGVLSGSYAIFGQATDGFEAYFKAVDAKGGINGYKINYKVYNDQYLPSTALSIAHQLVSDHVLAIVGGLGGTPVDAAAFPYLKSTGMPVIAPVSAGQTFKNVDSTNYFLMVPDYSQETRSMVDFAVQHLHTKSVAVVYQDDQAGIPAMQGVKYEAGKQGIQYDGGIPFPDTATAYTDYAAALAKTGADTAIIWGPSEAAAAIQKQATALGYHPKWILPFFDMEVSWLKIGGTPGTYFTSWLTTVDTQHPANANVAAFIKAMNKYYPKDGPGDLPEQGWAGASIFAQALKIATSGGKAPTRSSLLKALKSMNGYSNGVISGISYGTSHLGATQTEFLQNKGTNFVAVTGEKKLPAPVPGY